MTQLIYSLEHLAHRKKKTLPGWNNTARREQAYLWNYFYFGTNIA